MKQSSKLAGLAVLLGVAARPAAAREKFKIGIIGTVVSLTHVLENLSSPDHLGPMIAAAFVATLWGLLSANFIWLPLSAKLKRLSELDIARMTLLMEGLLAVQNGTQPLLLAERLRAMAPAETKGKSKQAKDKADDGDKPGKLSASRAA